MLKAARPRSALLLALAAGLLIGALLFLRAPQQVASLNADSLYMECLYRDVVQDHLPLKDWFMQPAPSLFPDLGVFIACRSLAGSIGPGYALYSAASFLLLIGSFYLLLRQIPGIRRHAGARTLQGGLLLLVVLGFGPALTPLFLPAYHAAILPMGLALLALDLRLRRQGALWGWTALASAGLALGCASDASLAIFFGLPVAVLALLHHFLSHKLKPGPWPYALLGASCLAGMAFHSLVRAGVFPIYQVPRIYAIWDLPGQAVEQVLRTATDLAQVLKAYPLAALACLAWLFLRRPWAGLRLRRMRRIFTGAGCRAHVALILSISMILSVLAPFGLCNGLDPRYVLPCFVFPSFLWVLQPFRFMRKPWLAWALVLAGMGQALWAAHSLPSLQKAFAPPAQEKFDWIESVMRQRGLHQGYCNYWDEKPALVYSDGRVRMAGLLEWNEPSCLFMLKAWVSSRAWWVGKPGQPFPIYDFVLTDSMDVERLKASFGPPADIERWQGHELWIYNRPGDVIFRNYLRKFLDGANGCHTFIGVPGLPRPRIADVLGSHSMRIESAKDVSIPFDPPVKADVMEFWGWQKDSWQVEFWQGSRFLRRLSLSGSGQPGLAVWCAKALPNEPFDRMVLRSTSGSEGLLRNIIFYPDSL
jgi:hypothetical protein